MESRVKVAGHPVHPMLIVFPLGLLATAVIFDLIALVSHASRWTEVAYYLIGAGVIGGLAAAVPGWIDWFAIPRRTRAKRIGLLHGIGNVLVLVLFATSWLLRRDNPAVPPTGAIVAGLLGIVLGTVTGWLGGELVGRLGIGVDDGAHLDAPSSLSALPAGAAGSAPSRPGTSASFGGVDRRGFPQPAYAGVERRRASPRP
ncbi:MAG TPA: DUF2231 domain-containing protein [Gemmatimonadales bacterium]|jgi:uncharacterized membrane protein|nr:DUF2231 domain-containing protein [Gemmatimonadales bacterium]